MRKRLAEGPQELRQAYMRLLLEGVTVGHHEVRLEGSPPYWRSWRETALQSRVQKFSLLHRDLVMPSTHVHQRPLVLQISQYYCHLSSILVRGRAGAYIGHMLDRS